MRFLKLVNLFVFRTIREERFLSLLSIIGVALGTGLFIGVKVASDRAVASFEAKVRGINPSANYEILDMSGIDFKEDIYRDVLKLDGESIPELKTTGYIQALGETIDIDAVYTVKAMRFLGSGSDRRYDIENLCRQPNGVFITKGFADRYGLKKGDEIRALVYSSEYALRVVDIFAQESLPGNSLIMDLGNFQDYFGRAGYLTRIGLSIDEEKAGEVRKMLPADLALEKTEGLLRDQRSLITSFRYNIQFISLIAILVGLFLLYNTIFISVVKRRTEIGILRGLGTSRKSVVMLFTVQGMILGLAGSVLGIAVGQGAAYFSAYAIGKTVSSIYGGISIGDYGVTPHDALNALVLGCMVSVTASLVPAYEASKVRPNESFRAGSFEGRYRGYQRYFSAAGVLFVAAGGIFSYADYRYVPSEFPFLSYTGILLLIAGFTFLSPHYLSLVLRVLRRPSEKVFGAMGAIALSDMRGNLYRFSVALMSVAISCSLIVALFTLIFSFRNSLETWIRRTISADIYIKPASCTSNFCFSPLPDEVITMIEGLPEVEGVDRFRNLQVDLFGRKIMAGFADTGLQRKLARPGNSEREARSKALESAREVSVSHYLSMRYGLKRGDTIEISTPAGRQRFTIYDTFTSYSTTSGFIFLDRKWLKEFWGLDDATQISLYLKKDVDVEKFIGALRDRLSGKYSLEILDNRALRNKVLTIFNRSFAVTYAIEVISIIVSLIGVINTLAAFVLERKREISILRYLGGSWEQIRRILVISAGVIGIAGTVLGVIAGLLMSVIFIRVINEISFGWEVRFGIPVLYLSFVALALFLTTLLAGLFPSRLARGIDPRRHISFE